MIQKIPDHLQSALNSNTEMWSLHRTHNYHNSLSIDIIDADSISEAQFHKEYVARNRPCLLVGAAKHWPANSRWTSRDYLKGMTPNVTVYPRFQPNIEYPYMAKKSIRESLDKMDEAMHEEMLLHDFIDKIVDQPSHYVLFGLIKDNEPYARLREDLDGYPCLPRPSGSRLYPPHRALLYRKSYTDWHYHAADETLMTQVMGTKEVVLLPPDPYSWKTVWSAIYDKGYIYGLNTEATPLAQGLQPYRVVVGPSDALYIPVFWWHAVESIDNEFGITVATTFKSPLHINTDLAYPAARRLMRKHLFSPIGPVFLGLAGYAAMHRFARKCKVL